VELKFAVESFPTIRGWLEQQQAHLVGTESQADLYLRHPARNFKETGEALRLRREGSTVHVTYKGPVVDRAVKARREIELPLGNEVRTFSQWQELFWILGFEPVFTVEKTRETWLLPTPNGQITVVLDDVHGLGQFIELELLAEESTREAARDTLLQLAAAWNLTQPERRSYLEQLLQKQGLE